MIKCQIQLCTITVTGSGFSGGTLFHQKASWHKHCQDSAKLTVGSSQIQIFLVDSLRKAFSTPPPETAGTGGELLSHELPAELGVALDTDHVS